MKRGSFLLVFIVAAVIFFMMGFPARFYVVNGTIVGLSHPVTTTLYVAGMLFGSATHDGIADTTLQAEAWIINLACALGVAFLVSPMIGGKRK